MENERIYLGNKAQITEIGDADTFIVATNDGIRRMAKAQVMEKLGINQLTKELEKHQDASQNGNYVPAPATAEVGQVVVVKAVDENGKPTEWKAVDMPSGGPTDAVQYVEQALTEEQQMQTRANLGLYGKKSTHPLIADFRYYGWWEYLDGSDSLDSSMTNSIKVNISGGGVYYCDRYSDNSYDFGTDSRRIISIIGNPALSPYSNKFDYDGSEYPFAIWHDTDSGWGIAVDSTISVTMGMSITVEDTSVTIEEIATVPEEYLPPVILKDADGNRYTLTVNPDTLELIVGSA